MSIEVAEHIPAQFEANFVNNLGTLLDWFEAEHHLKNM